MIYVGPPVRGWENLNATGGCQRAYKKVYAAGRKFYATKYTNAELLTPTAFKTDAGYTLFALVKYGMAYTQETAQTSKLLLRYL